MEYEGQLDDNAQLRLLKGALQGQRVAAPACSRDLPVRGCGGAQTQCEQILSISIEESHCLLFHSV